MFYITTDNGAGDIFQMDAVVAVTYTQTGTLTKYSVEAGFNVSDHYRQQPDRITFSGEVSTTKFARRVGPPSTDLATFETGMQTLKKSGKAFSCSFSDNLVVMKNCRFTALQMERNQTTGLHALKVEFSIEQTKVANQAQVANAPVPIEWFADDAEANSTKSGSTWGEGEDSKVFFWKSDVDELTKEQKQLELQQAQFDN